MCRLQGGIEMFDKVNLQMTRSLGNFEKYLSCESFLL